MSLLLYFMAHWVLVLTVTLAVLGLGAAAYVFKNLKFALAAVALAVAGFMYQGAVMHGIQLQIANDAAFKIEILEDNILTMNKAAALHNAKALQDAAQIDVLESKANETPANSSGAISRDAASRVRAIR